MQFEDQQATLGVGDVHARRLADDRGVDAAGKFQ